MFAQELEQLKKQGFKGPRFSEALWQDFEEERILRMQREAMPKKDDFVIPADSYFRDDVGIVTLH